jgi:glycogen debranching enzyme
MEDNLQTGKGADAGKPPDAQKAPQAVKSGFTVVGRRRGLQVVVGRRQSREYILTNKEKAYFAGETGTTNTRSYEGLIVELHKFIEGWDLMLGDTALSSWGVASACVLPQSMTREYVVEKTTETVFLADRVNVLILTFSSNYRGRAAFLPRFDIRSIWEEGRPEYETHWDPERNVLALRRADHPERTPSQNYPVWVAIACDRSAGFVPEPGYRTTTYTKDAARRAMGSAIPYAPGRIEFRFEGDAHFAANITFSVAVGDSLHETVNLARLGIEDEFSLYDAKMRRVSEVIATAGGAMRDGDYRYALQWAAASVDSLIMDQLGRGIFAGLHWFPNYWGRDTFISLPGACLVRGDFGTAREIIRSFASLQNTNKEDPLFGRVPNFAMPGEIYYNTADGTCWFVREVCEYLRYSGDLPFAVEILPVVERAIEGAVAKRVDEDGLLRHGQADTWMDAGGEEHPYSPRGDRAVEVEALWYAALGSGAAIASAAGRDDLRARWDDRADRVRGSFRKTFWDSEGARLYDHVNPDGTADLKIRPNQILAITVPCDPLIPSDEQEKVTRLVGDTCVLPHGVTTLAPSDPEFHPRHLDLDHYHFDEAYHNGDVWVWLTGPVVTAFTRFGLVGRAWEQTKVLADLFFEEGAAGTLPELRNGVPPETGENVAGAVSQAWSLAEFLRNFYQDYVGLVPDLLAGELSLHPMLPRALSWLQTRARVGDGQVDLVYTVSEDGATGRFLVSADDRIPPLRVHFSTRVPLTDDVRPRTVSTETKIEPGTAREFVVARSGGGWSIKVSRPRVHRAHRGDKR